MKNYLLILLSCILISSHSYADSSLLQLFTNNYVGYIFAYDKKGVSYVYGFTNFQISPNGDLTGVATKKMWATNFIKNVNFKGNVVSTKLVDSNSFSMYITLFINGKTSDGSRFRSVMNYNHLFLSSNQYWLGDIYLAKGKKYFGGGSIAFSP